MDVITTILAFLVAIGVLIVVHELGHYSVARWCGVKVLRFSVGFGKPILRRVHGADRTEWVVSAIPYGGYVKMLDENDPDCQPISPEDLPRAFNRQSVAKRSAIVVAGPAANLLFAVLAYWLIFSIGTLEPRPYLGAPAQGSPAAQAGLQEGDLVLDLQGRAVRSWGEFRWLLLQDGIAGKQSQMTVRDLEGREHTVSLDLSSAKSEEIDDNWFDHIGIEFGTGPAIVRELPADMPAAKAGLAVGDQIVAIDGAPVATADAVRKIVRARPGQNLDLLVDRNGTQQRFAVTTVSNRDDPAAPFGQIGVGFGSAQTVQYPPMEALQRGVQRTWDTCVFSIRMVGRMLDGRASWRNLSGPVSVADVAGQSARVGALAYLTFLALVSINLGVLNLLPIPVLDGGHLLYYAVEVVKGSPPSVRAVEVAQRVGVGMLIILTVLALYNDLTRLLS